MTNVIQIQLESKPQVVISTPPRPTVSISLIPKPELTFEVLGKATEIITQAEWSRLDW